MDDVRAMDVPTLLLLNGLPGVGKSSVAWALAATRPGTLVLDVDVVRALIAGDPRAAAEPARRLGLDMARSQLRAGCGVVVPQLVARADQVTRFERAAAEAGARFVHAVLEAPPATVAARVARDVAAGRAAHRRGLDDETLAAYATGLRDVTRATGAVRVDAGADVAGVARRVEPLLG